MPTLTERFVGGVVWAALVAAWSYRRRKLSLDGAIAAFVTGVVITSAGVDRAAALLWFFFSSTLLTRVGKQRKSSIEEGYEASGNRNWVQVLSNSLPGVVCAIAELVTGDARFGVGTWASLCCAIGDTWSSEVGVLSKSQPRLITTLQRVPPGTNGGVSALGLAAALVGGATLAIVAALAGGSAPDLSLVAAFVGFSLLGSVIDSLLGATLQLSMYDPKTGKVSGRRTTGAVLVCGRNVLDNHAVNLLSNALTTAIAVAAVAQ